MDDFVKNCIDSLLGNETFSSWTGYNMPTDIEKRSNLWVAKAGARVFRQGFHYDPKVSALHIEWGAVAEGEMLLTCRDREYRLQQGMFYLMPDSVVVTARPVRDPFLVWVEFTGSLSESIFELMGGRMNEVITGSYTLEQIKMALNIAYLLQYHPHRYNLSVQSMLWRLISGYSGTRMISGKFSADIQKAVDYINLAPPGDCVTVSRLAAASMLSRETFRKKFHSEVGEAPIQYLLRYRIAKAKEQLMDTSKSIKQIAFETGFKDPYYFSRLFKQYEGMSPLLFRKTMNYQPEI